MARLGFMLRSAWPLTQAHLSHLLLYTNPALMDSHVKTRELNRVGQGSREIRKGKAVSSLPVIQASPRSLLQQLRMSTVITRPLPSAPALCFPSKCQPIWPLLDSALPKRCYLLSPLWAQSLPLFWQLQFLAHGGHPWSTPSQAS